MTTPEQLLYQSFKRRSPPESFIQRIEPFGNAGIPDIFIQLPLSTLDYKLYRGDNANGAYWLETKVLPYQVSDSQINWWIRYVRAGGMGGIISWLSYALAYPCAALQQPDNTLPWAKQQQKASNAQIVCFWPLHTLQASEIEEINTHLKKGTYAVPWGDFLAQLYQSKSCAI